MPSSWEMMRHYTCSQLCGIYLNLATKSLLLSKENISGTDAENNHRIAWLREMSFNTLLVETAITVDLFLLSADNRIVMGQFRKFDLEGVWWGWDGRAPSPRIFWTNGSTITLEMQDLSNQVAGMENRNNRLVAAYSTPALRRTRTCGWPDTWLTRKIMLSHAF